MTARRRHPQGRAVAVEAFKSKGADFNRPRHNFAELVTA